MSVDLHSGQIQGFFDGPVDHLTAMPVLVDYIRDNLPEDMVVVSPDAGRVKVAERYTNQLNADLAIVHKRRVKGVKNTVEAVEIVGDVEGPHLRDHRRHDRHRRHDLRGRRPAAGAGGHRDLRAGHPRRAVRPGHRPVQELGDHARSSSPTPCRCRPRSRSTRSRCSRSPRSWPPPSTPCSRTTPSARSSTAPTRPDPPRRV